VTSKYVYIVLFILLLTSEKAACSNVPMFTGEVFSQSAQSIYVPYTTNWRATISQFAPEGQKVEVGDLIVQFDGSETAALLDQHQETTRAEAATAERDLAQLDKEYLQAFYGVKQAAVSLELAKLRSELPQNLIGALEYSERQLAKTKAELGLREAGKLLADKQHSLYERKRQATLDKQKAELTAKWWREILETLSIRATQRGYVIHSNHPWSGAKFQEGDTVRTSFKIAEVADTSDLAIRVWVNGVDRPHIESGATVEIVFDAFPQKVLRGRLETIADSASKRPEWGNASYFVGTVSFDAKTVPGLMPGMSALVEVRR